MIKSEVERDVIHSETVPLSLTTRDRRVLIRRYGVTILAALSLAASATIQDHGEELHMPSWSLTALMIAGVVFAGVMFFGGFLTFKAHMDFSGSYAKREVILDRRARAILLVDNGVLHRQLRFADIANFSLRFERSSRATESDTVETASYTVTAEMRHGEPPVKLGEFYESASERVGTSLSSNSISALETRAKAFIGSLKRGVTANRELLDRLRPPLDPVAADKAP